MKRLLFVDNLKLNLIILVILHHVAVAYGGSGSWPIVEQATDNISPIVFTMFTALNQSFFMSLFFLLSGYFTAISLTRKSTAKYLKDRLIRLGIPLLGYVLLIAPMIDYLVVKFGKGMDVTFFQAVSLGWDVGPLWFVEALLIFSLIYLFFRSKSPLELFKDRFPTKSSIFLTILILGSLTFIVRIFFPINKWIHVFQFAHFVHYIFAFYIGIVAYNNNWFEHLDEKQSKTWKIVAIITIFALPIMMGGSIILFGATEEPFLGGFGWQSLSLSFWDTIACISIIISLLFIFKERFNTQGKLAKWASPNYYGAYIFHALIIILLMIPLLESTLPSTLKALIVAVIAVPLCFAFTALFRKIPYVKRVLG